MTHRLMAARPWRVSRRLLDGTLCLGACVLGLLLSAAAGAAVGGDVAVAVTAAAAPAEVQQAWSGARLQGQMRYRWFGLTVYDAHLWLPGASPALTEQDFAQREFMLTLSDARRLEGAAIAERSLQEMQRLGALEAARGAAWLAAMKAVFPDVQPGDRLTGHHRSGQATLFLLNGRPAGTVADPEFARWFFGIWLHPRSAEPRLRAALLGAAP